MAKSMISMKEDLAMSNKRFPKLAVLSLLGVLSLTACNSSSSEVYAKPSTYKDPIIEVEGSTEKIHNNILSIIYDSMHDGSVPSEVLSKVLYAYAESVFGTYEELKAAKENAELVGSDYAIVNAFIKAHKSYWYYNEEGKHVDDLGQPVDDKTFTPGKTEQQNVVSKFNAIEQRIAESMYTKATGGSYTNKHFFDELKYVRSLFLDGKSVDYEAALAMSEQTTDPLRPVIVDYKIEKDEVFTEGILHEEFYRNPAKGITYIEDEVLEDVYGDLLVEQYLLDEELAAVRNSRARKINVLKIEKYSSFSNNADALVKKLVEEIYSDVPAASETVVDYKVENIEARYDALFEKYANVSKGLYDDIMIDGSESKELVESLQEIAGDIYEEASYGSYHYFKNTTYGDLIEDYKEFKEAGNDYEKLDLDLYNKFTGTGTTTEAEALDQATIDIDQTKTITKGWFINSTQPSLDSNGEINNRLFKLSVANSKLEIADDADPTEGDLKTLTELDRIQFNSTDNKWELRAEADPKENSYLCSINGAYFLKFAGHAADDDWWNDIVYDDGSAYYVVQVMEAAKDNKLRNAANNKYSYSETRGLDFLNEVIEEVSKKVAETGSYASLSKEYWLKKMNIKYHDQDVYDYFKSNYPDLFK